ncbi:MAG: acetate--CoA ligase family protein [Chloroflexota bacterium]
MVVASAPAARPAEILRRARAAGLTSLPEPDGLVLVEALGIAVPRRIVLTPGRRPTARDIEAVPGDRLVVKVVAPGIAHKSDVGGVVVVERDPDAVAAAIAGLDASIGPGRLTGILVEELVAHDSGPGGELLVSLRWTADFGPIVGVGLGGVHAEQLARDLQPGRELAMFEVDRPGAEIADALRGATAVRLATEPQRGRAALVEMTSLVAVVERLASLAPLTGPGGLRELEINPLALTPDGLVALDVLTTLDSDEAAARRIADLPVRPLWKLGRLLRPTSIAIAGVSASDNPGRTILRNLLREGFEPGRIVVVKPGATSIDGCACVPDVASMREKVDLFVIALSATRTPALLGDVVASDAAHSIIVIPGGLEETGRGQVHAEAIRTALLASRARPGGGPLVNGGNCLGIRSRPGGYDTFFIPEAKLPPSSGPPAPLAIVAQSGAFALSRLSRLAGLDPTYVISVGNQLDLTIGDWLEHLAADPAIRVIGVYVEGFAPLDGRRFLAAARTIVARGRTVILYRAGRTAAGASASASHTAAIAGDALVTRRLAEGAGVVVADDLEAFDDLVRTFVRLDRRTVSGRRLGAMSNAGFECVAIADNLARLSLAPFTATTRQRLAAILAGAGIGEVVEVHDPFDLSPMGDDATFAAVAEAILADDGVDVGLVGNVPFTATLQTLPAEAGRAENLAAPEAVAARLVDLWQRTTKAWLAVVDAGPLYDPLAGALDAGGIPVFRTADAALRALGAFVERSLGGFAGSAAVDGRSGPA